MFLKHPLHTRRSGYVDCRVVVAQRPEVDQGVEKEEPDTKDPMRSVILGQGVAESGGVNTLVDSARTPSAMVKG